MLVKYAFTYSNIYILAYSGIREKIREKGDFINEIQSNHMEDRR